VAARAGWDVRCVSVAQPTELDGGQYVGRKYRISLGRLRPHRPRIGVRGVWHDVRVPRVLGAGYGWLHTAGLPGRSAADPRWRVDPRTAAHAIGSGLRTLHDRVPVGGCPFSWSAAVRRAELPPERRVGLADPPPIDRLVVCHGDACAPNALLDDGRCSGHVDLGELGVADRWADIAVATLSPGWNFGDGPWGEELLAGYGVPADAARTEYYRRLWQAGDIPSR
jgi:kanamycin kinase